MDHIINKENINGLAFILLFLLFNVFYCAAGDRQTTLRYNIIPTPMEIRTDSGYFEITNKTAVITTAVGVEATDYLIQRIKKVAGLNLAELSGGPDSKIEFVIDTSFGSMGKESYSLLISERAITIRAADRPGFLYAVQTMIQLLPPELVGETKQDNISLKLPCVYIKDTPKYKWRSFMLDSGRQFQTKEFIKRYLDYLAMLKMNVFHWHLTEGQGWRIEIKKYPKLTEIGSRVADGGEQQGYYSQEDIREIVEYAKKLCITVAPEIDVPGHSEAALIAYPELTCFGKKPETVMEYSPILFCGGRESTYKFLQDILDEVCDLFPGEYIHLGGDEAPKDVWDLCSVCQSKILDEGLRNSHELQIYFSSRLADYLKGKGRKVILWGDVVEHGGPLLPDNVIIYWWNYRKKHDAAYRAAVEMGYPIICGTNYYTYLNFPVTPWARYQGDRTFDMRQAYESNPSDLSKPSKLVLGMGTCLWTDWYVKMYMIDQRVFPRLLVLAQQMWSTEDKIPFPEFSEGVKRFYPRLKALGIQYGPALKEEVPVGYKWE
mgnify:CR=1 FL=1